MKNRYVSFSMSVQFIFVKAKLEKKDDGIRSIYEISDQSSCEIFW